MFQRSSRNWFLLELLKLYDGSSDSNKKAGDKDSSSSVKDPFSNPFGSDAFGELVFVFFLHSPSSLYQ